jgi:hypothetical protein
MKFEINIPSEETPELRQRYLDALYEQNTSFNCLIKRDGALVAVGRGEKSSDGGFRFSTLRYYGTTVKRLKDLENCDVELRVRAEDITVRTFKLDNLTRTSKFNELSVTAKVF